MTTLYLDIETLPALGMTEAEKREAVKVPGTYKKADSIEAFIRENAEEQWRKSAVDSMRGEVLCIGWALDDEDARVVYRKPGCDERSVLDEWAAMLALDGITSVQGRSSTTIIGHNILGFDLPWLRRRALRYSMRDLAVLLDRGKWGEQVEDTMLLWAGTAYREYHHLDDIARYLGVGRKAEGIDGSKIYDAWLGGEHDRIAAYCADDVRLTRAVYQRITGQ